MYDGAAGFHILERVVKTKFMILDKVRHAQGSRSGLAGAAVHQDFPAILVDLVDFVGHEVKVYVETAGYTIFHGNLKHISFYKSNRMCVFLYVPNNLANSWIDMVHNLWKALRMNQDGFSQFI